MFERCGNLFFILRWKVKRTFPVNIPELIHPPTSHHAQVATKDTENASHIFFPLRRTLKNSIERNDDLVADRESLMLLTFQSSSFASRCLISNNVCEINMQSIIQLFSFSKTKDYKIFFFVFALFSISTIVQTFLAWIHCVCLHSICRELLFWKMRQRLELDRECKLTDVLRWNELCFCVKTICQQCHRRSNVCDLKRQKQRKSADVILYRPIAHHYSLQDFNIENVHTIS